jgi:tetratricopeptide (TPR) repeat protein
MSVGEGRVRALDGRRDPDPRLAARVSVPHPFSVGVFVVSVACFLPALRNGFVMWDDDLLLTTNPYYRGLSWRHLVWMATTVHGGHYDPLTWLTYAIDHALWGMDARGYHLTSVLLHGTNAVLVFWLTNALLWRAGLVDGTRRSLAAAAGALFFALHPLRVESVVWASERRDVLCGVFYLLAVLAYVRIADGIRTGTWLGVSFGCFLLSLLAKPWAMTLPAVLLVLDVYPLRRRGPRARLLLEKLPYLVFAVAAAAVAAYALEVAGARRPTLAEFGVGQRLAQASFGLCFYVWKTLVPLGLSPLYPFDVRLDPTAPPYLLSVSVVVVAAASLFVWRKRAPWAIAAAACYALIALPVLGFAQAGSHAVADRYSYLACLPWAVLGAAAAYAAADRASRATAASVAVVLVALGVLTVRQTGVWRDTLTLWEHAVRVVPTSSDAHVERGRARQANDPRGALADFDAAIALDRTNALAYSVRGNARYAAGDLNAALADYTAAIDALPRYASAYYSRGVVWQDKGNLDAAAADYGEAIRLNPRDPRPWNNRGVVRAARGDVDGALADYAEALRLDAGFVLPYLNRARARRTAGDRAGAIADLEAALRRAPAGSRSCTTATRLMVELGVTAAACTGTP